MGISRWDAWLADLDPVIGSEQGKTRSVLVISESTLKQETPLGSGRRSTLPVLSIGDPAGVQGEDRGVPVLLIGDTLGAEYRRRTTGVYNVSTD